MQGIFLPLERVNFGAKVISELLYKCNWCNSHKIKSLYSTKYPSYVCTLLSIHSVEIYEFYCQPGFYVKSILVNWEFQKLQFLSFIFSKFQLPKSAESHQNQNLDVQKVWYCQNSNIWHFKLTKNWFHVKSEWQKNSLISTWAQYMNRGKLPFVTKSFI